MPDEYALPGYNAKLVVNSQEVFYSDIGPADNGDPLDVSRTGPAARRKKRIVGQISTDITVSLVWYTDQNPETDPPNFVVGQVLDTVDWYPSRDDTGHYRYTDVSVVSAQKKGPVADALRWDVTLAADDVEWVD